MMEAFETFDPTEEQIETLLRYVPEHSRTTCSDEKPSNGYTTGGRGGAPRCQRCALVTALRDPAYRRDLRVALRCEVRISVSE